MVCHFVPFASLCDLLNVGIWHLAGHACMCLVPAILFDEDCACGGKSKCVRGMQVLL